MKCCAMPHPFLLLLSPVTPKFTLLLAKYATASKQLGKNTSNTYQIMACELHPVFSQNFSLKRSLLGLLEHATHCEAAGTSPTPASSLYWGQEPSAQSFSPTLGLCPQLSSDFHFRLPLVMRRLLLLMDDCNEEHNLNQLFVNLQRSRHFLAGGSVVPVIGLPCAKIWGKWQWSAEGQMT